MANALAQIGAVTGRRRYPRYGPLIRERASFLPAQYAERERQQVAEAELDLRRKALEHGKDQAQLANKLAIGTLATQGALLVPQYRALGRTAADPSKLGAPANALSRSFWPGVGGGAAGGISGSVLAGELTDNRVAQIAAGAGLGGLGGYLAGGDQYSAAIGAVTGGLIGGIF